MSSKENLIPYDEMIDILLSRCLNFYLLKDISLSRHAHTHTHTHILYILSQEIFFSKHLNVMCLCHYNYY